MLAFLYPLQSLVMLRMGKESGGGGVVDVVGCRSGGLSLSSVRETGRRRKGAGCDPLCGSLRQERGESVNRGSGK